MPLATNTRLGRYEIRSQIGAGGMGEVYRARDPKINRDVAIKVLPAAFSADAERLRRFEQEAQAAGALNHPNILAIHDVDAHDGYPYVVSELLEGETLHRLMGGAALPQRKAVDYAHQIAQGLTAAHERGIVHRDLKPENIFVTNDGRVKILDFGIAKLVERGDGVAAQTDLPTRHLNTDPGAVIGTAGYMSPEQVRGQRVDHRSDIFSFGAVLYEMLSGRRAFKGDSAVETLNAILKEDPPDLSATNSQITPALERVVKHCLEKNLAQRFQSARDLAFALEALSAPSGAHQTQAPRALPTAEKARTFLCARERLMWVAASLLLTTAALVSTLLYVRRPSPEAQVTRFSINLPAGTNTAATAAPTLSLGTNTAANSAPVLALSPDGRRLVFDASDAAGKSQLWLRPLDSFSTQPLPGTDGATFPFWSPDGRHVAFFADNKLKRLDVGSGVIETVCQAGPGTGDWNRNGVILFSGRSGTSLSRVNAAGGQPEAVTELDAERGETNHNFPSFLPDGNHFLFHIRGGDNPGIYVGSFKARDSKLLIPLSKDGANATRAVWSPPGYILYALNRTTLLARAFDPERLELQGEPFRVADNLIVSEAGNARFAVSANGVLAFIQGGAADIVQLTWRDREGKRLGVIGPAAPWLTFRLSPDERSAALIRDEPSRQSSLWLLDLSQGATTRFITEGNNLEPVWSPDGNQLAFASARNSPPTVFLKPLAGNVPEEQLLESRFQSSPASWSPDGKFLIYAVFSPLTRGDIWLLPLYGERKPQPLFQTKAGERFARVSPDGNWLAYQSDESGANEIYVTQFPQPARSWRISTSGGVNPFWRGDGKELFFVSGNKLMAVSTGGIISGAEFQSGTPQPLFEIDGINYAPGKDGQRFLTGVVTEKAPALPISVVLNWPADLKH